MKHLLCFGSMLLLMMPAHMLAQSPFDGTWKINLAESQSSTKPAVYLLQGGTYHCPTCDPPLEIPADGGDHKITGEPCYDTVSIKVVDDRTTEEIDREMAKRLALQQWLSHSTEIQPRSSGRKAAMPKVT